VENLQRNQLECPAVSRAVFPLVSHLASPQVVRRANLLANHPENPALCQAESPRLSLLIVLLRNPLASQQDNQVHFLLLPVVSHLVSHPASLLISLPVAPAVSRAAAPLLLRRLPAGSHQVHLP